MIYLFVAGYVVFSLIATLALYTACWVSGQVSCQIIHAAKVKTNDVNNLAIE